MMARNPFVLATLVGLLIAAFSCRVKEPGKSGPPVHLSDSALNRKYNVDQIKLPPHFKMGVFAEVPGARSLCESPLGTLFVGTMSGDVYALRDTDKNGV